MNKCNRRQSHNLPMSNAKVELVEKAQVFL